MNRDRRLEAFLSTGHVDIFESDALWWIDSPSGIGPCREGAPHDAISPRPHEALSSTPRKMADDTSDTCRPASAAPPRPP